LSCQIELMIFTDFLLFHWVTGGLVGSD
jgi:hypothetical protein